MGVVKKQVEFRPNDSINRAELAKMLVETFNIPVSETPQKVFSDVEENTWFSGYVQGLKDAKVVSGYSDNSYKPNNNVNRAEAVKMILISSGVKDFSGNQSFQDVPKGSWFEPYVAYAFKEGIVKGKNEKEFQPNANITRAEIAKVLFMIRK